MCFAFSGFEVAATLREEVKDAERTIPRGLLVAAVADVGVYVIGSAAILVALPADALSERTGIAEAVELMAGRLGVGGLGALTGVLIVLSGLALTASWVAASARVPFAASEDRLLPASFARLHPRFRTPYRALVAQGAIASASFLTSLFLGLGGAAPTVRDAYDILINLTILVCFVPYLYMFPALLRLRRRQASVPAGFRVPGGRLGLGLTVGSGFLATALSMALVFVPPPGTANVLNYEANVIGQSSLILAAGLALYRWRRPQ
jgi:amino acid transporter